ncbi:MAG: 2-isopropylmalate synthase [Clostridiales bacterium]|jgi:isopropylmalate/homocitrate/citramalate synthase|nr:2-isopropylmalate synthase [Clostridiales bacterium]
MKKKRKPEQNKTTGLWYLREHNYELQNPKEPELYRGIFDYNQVPKIIFNDRRVPMNPADNWWITDTTFRDGQQSTAPLSVHQIVDIYKLLNKLGGPRGVIRATEFFLYNEKDREAVRKCQELGLAFPQITSWIRANEKDFKLVKEMNIDETGILVSCSDYHIYKKMNLDRRQAMDKYLDLVKKCLDSGIVPRCHLEDITRADFYGFVVPFVRELMRLSDEARIPVKVRACDTLGYGVTFPGSALPRSVQGLIYGLNYYAEVPSEWLEWHGHNDFYKAVVNATQAWLYGCGNVNCSLLGIGERTGNCPTEAMCVEYAQMRGTTGGMDLTVITEIADYFEHEVGYDIPPRTPFVGKAFNATRAGIHADGLLKDEEIYNVFDTYKLLGKRPVVSISNTSGLAGIAFWINSYYDLEGDDAVEKSDPVVAAVKAEVDKAYEAGRNTVMGDDELDNLVFAADEERHHDFEYNGAKAKRRRERAAARAAQERTPGKKNP